MRALWGRMKMPPWLNILSDVAGTQYAADETLQTFELVIAKDGLDMVFASRSWLSDVRNFVT